MPRFRAGATSLRPLEVEEMGDVAGKRLVHLQCHFGQDTLSWARIGARVTGLDLAPRAVEMARAGGGDRRARRAGSSSPMCTTHQRPGRALRHRLHRTRHDRERDLRGGLRIEFPHEHAVTYFNQFYNLVQHENGTFHRPPGLPRVPMIFSLRATKLGATKV